ncbi:MAG TPA: DUF305 domain-containing protein [Acidimicrobiales bacterium]|jgi:uncharacterized protein (DUF305 family)|nr:DUF305 domain-containing protein [Acidimicrobiales bacterium]
MDDELTTDARPWSVVAAENGDGGEGPGDGDAEAEADLARRLGWAKQAILGAAVLFLGIAIGMVVARDRPPGEGSVDVGFLQDMLTHHDQALGVATLVVANGKDPTVRSYAREILVFQGYEVGVMSQMLDDWGYSRSDRSDQAMAWMGMPVPVGQMPGLLTDEQLDQLRDADGAELDALFLDLMADHHRGGLHMAEYAFGNAGDGDVRELAARIARNQAGEINEYRALAARNGYDIDIDPASVPADIAEAGETGGD